MSLLIDANEGPSSNSSTVVPMVANSGSSAFHRVPPSASNPSSKPSSKPSNSTNQDSPTPVSSVTSESPPTLTKRPPFDEDEDDEDDDRRDRDSRTDEDFGPDNAFAWPTHNSYDEQRQLLGTEEESSDHATSDEDEDLIDVGGEAASSGKKYVWNITREQINYYTTQFFCMQPDPDGVIPGALAKEFFEKSRLPISELRKIWQLSDVSQDGCLSLDEFLTAMHLVVLRRNDIDLPDELPPVLRPVYLKQKLVRSKLVRLQGSGNQHNKDLYNGGMVVTDDTDDDLGAKERLIDDSASLATKPEEDEVDSNKSQKEQKSSVEAAETASIVSSPGRPQPVNFDFHRQDALRRDPTIVQPVAVRLSPDSPIVQSSDLDEDEDTASKNVRPKKATRGEVSYEKLWNAGGKDEDEDLEAESAAAENGPISLPASAQPQQQQQQQQQRLCSPPPPPPRPSHARSSSLDLNNLQRPPAVPPRYGAAEAHSPSAASNNPRPLAHQSSTGGLSRDGRALQCRILEYREKNSVVARTINELHQEVSDALEERIALEYQLEQLKSFGDE